jgi:hypothetical protein
VSPEEEKENWVQKVEDGYLTMIEITDPDSTDE